MTVSQAPHAEKVVERFRSMISEAGHSLQEEHYRELALLIEAALDAVAIDRLETMARKLEAMAHAVRHDEDFFTSA